MSRGVSFICEKVQDLRKLLRAATIDQLLVLFRGKLHALRGLKQEAALMALLLNRRNSCTGSVTGQHSGGWIND